MVTTSLRSLALAAVAFVACLTNLSAQQKAPSDAQGNELPVFKSVVRRVVVDVVVTGPDGKPVHGLTQKDFAVEEDRRPQLILSFDTHDLEAASDFAKLPPLRANTFVNVPTTPERGPLYVLLLDLVNTEMGDEAYARQQLLKFISDKPQGTRFAIFALSDGLNLIQGFTDDQKQLYAALDPSHPRPHVPRIFLYQSNNGRGNVGLMVSVFTFISRFLEGLPGRKNLIWFSGGFPMQLFPNDRDAVDYRDEVKQALDAMAEGQVAVYPVDIRGVTIDNPRAPSGATGGGGITSDYRNGGPAEPAADAAQGSQSTGASFSNSAQAGGGAGYSLLANSYMIQDEIARTTGGRAFHSNNGLKDLLETAVEDGGNYYTLSYSPTNRRFDGSLRKIDVELAEKGYQLSYRRSYYADNPDAPPLPLKGQGFSSSPEPPPRKLGDSLYANMQHGAPLAHQIVFRAHVHAVSAPAMATPEQMANLAEQPGYFSVRRKNRPAKPLKPVQLATYAVDYAIMAQARQGTSGRNVRPPALEMAVAAFDADGRMLNGVVENTSPATPRPSAETTGLYRARQEIDVPVSATSIRIAVRDMTTDRIGALEVTLPLAPEAPEQATAPAQPAADPTAPKSN